MSINNKINVAVIGATGYTGLDLVLILSKHPRVKIKYLCATKNLGKNISFFDKRIKKKLPKITIVNDVNWKNVDLVFLSLPNREAQKLIKKKFFKFKHLKFIDLSADFRISDPKIYKKNYKIEHKDYWSEVFENVGNDVMDFVIESDENYIVAPVDYNDD